MTDADLFQLIVEYRDERGKLVRKSDMLYDAGSAQRRASNIFNRGYYDYTDHGVRVYVPVHRIHQVSYMYVGL